MALKTIKTDDLDPTTEATHEITLVIDGTAFKLDLNDTHFAEAQADLSKWVEAGQIASTRRTGSGQRSAGNGGSITHPSSGANVTKAEVRKWVATKDEAWAKANNVMGFLRVDDEGVLRLAGPHYVPPTLSRMLAEEEAAEKAPTAQAEQSAAPAEQSAQAETPAPKPQAARKAAQPKASAKA